MPWDTIGYVLLGIFFGVLVLMILGLILILGIGLIVGVAQEAEKDWQKERGSCLFMLVMSGIFILGGAALVIGANC